jgi:hypothetical protein
MQDAILSMTEKALFYQTTIRPMPKDYPISLIQQIFTKRYLYNLKNENKNKNYPHNDSQNNFTYKQLLPKD